PDTVRAVHPFPTRRSSDLILEAENDHANRYKLSKQPDVLMLFYLFSPEELCELLGSLGYEFTLEDLRANVAYYDCRSSHGSTLSDRKSTRLNSSHVTTSYA